MGPSPRFFGRKRPLDRWSATIAGPGSAVRLRLPSRLMRRPLRRVVFLAALLVFLLLLSPLSPISRALPITGALGGTLASFFGGGHGWGWSLGDARWSWGRHDVLRFVDPLIGTTNGGHVFPGASLPYGMAKPCPDTLSRGENAAGFVSDSAPVIGFSHLHDSGTGGAASMGNFPIFVHPGCQNDDITKCRYATQSRMISRVNNSAEARPGYFAINLTNAVRAEMTATAHTSLFRFTFPQGPKVKYLERETIVPLSPLLLVDLNDIANSRSLGGVQIHHESGRITGNGQFRSSFGQGNFKAYFCADTRGAKIKKTGTFQGDKPAEEPKSFEKVASGMANPTTSGGAWIQFEPPSPGQLLTVRMGLSFLSSDQACANAEAEISDFSFDRVVNEAEDAWRDKLSAVQVDAKGVSDELQTVFWSGLYRTMLSPQNYTGENPLWDSDEPYFDSFYCIWDSFRAQHPLLTIIDPGAQTQMVKALLDIYKHVGKLPDCRMSFNKGFTQGGSNADVVLADAFIKKLPGGIDWDVAYEAVVSDAEEPPDNFDLEGRGNLDSWHKLNYIPCDDHDKKSRGRNTRSVSRTMEYAYDDFAVATLAQGLGRPEAEFKKFLRRSGNWQNVWNKEQVDFFNDADHGYNQRSRFTGFPQPRLRNGSFKYQNTRTCSPVNEMHRCYLDTTLSTYEGSPWLYSFYVPQNMAGLADMVGGRQELVDRLKYYHEAGIAYMGNEQSFLTVFQFHYGGRPGLSSRWVRNYIPSQFNASVGGLPGNDDCAMGAFSGMSMMGFFPVAGQDVYLIIPPFFREVQLRTSSKHNAVIRKVGDFADDPEALYIKSAKLNRRPYHFNWITHQFFLEGGTLELEVSREEGDWGAQEADLPPSYASGALFNAAEFMGGEDRVRAAAGDRKSQKES